MIADKQMLDEWPVVKTIFKENVKTWIWLKSSINISPREQYMLNLEVLVSGKTENPNIRIDQQDLGNCKPRGTECSFFDCTKTLKKRFVSSDTGSIFLALQYKPINHQCDCTEEKTNCGKDEEISSLKNVATAVRITLTPIGIRTMENKDRLSLVN